MTRTSRTRNRENDESRDREESHRGSLRRLQLQPHDRGTQRIDQGLPDAVISVIGMQHPSSEARALGVEALRQGDARKARESFEHNRRGGQADASAYLGSPMPAAASRTTRRRAPRSIAHSRRAAQSAALIMKADYLDALGDAAQRHPSTAPWSAPLRPPTSCRRSAQRTRQGAGPCARATPRNSKPFSGSGSPPRGSSTALQRTFSDSLDILTARRRSTSRPRQYFFPGLPQIQFLREGRFSVARQGRSGDGGYPRGADRDPEAGVGVQAYVEGHSNLPRRMPRAC